MDGTMMEYHPDQPISFALAANLDEASVDLKAKMNAARDAEDVMWPVVNTLMNFAFQATTSIRHLEMEVQQLRARLDT